MEDSVSFVLLLLFLVTIVIGQWVVLFASIWFLFHFQFSTGLALLVISLIMSWLHNEYKKDQKHGR
ncbi:hypothetical protein NIES2135_26580 [Leptolyngbya boryana NIES-2135]|jgi:hypothetical protein|uniref:Uncharacterized protein n=1 Tax=Leptolyngbya boryana NIES-2135 TaxID=1973484 RepID=A0A1Z4JGE6_LEPBY|nr:hypothetical protein LBWT_39250 [Leptolyngbya boryana IAM M-101]BAS64308.1 hypothetical protein LBDG_39250 [Leptolyngbya boryana dg5]BAY55834.1 hypothetical protein NIES2135_26580 [Leptolyngbya boryana NIES-2135]